LTTFNSNESRMAGGVEVITNVVVDDTKISIGST